MPASECVIDSSVVIALDYIEALPNLSFLFSRVLISRSVREELFRRRRTKDRLRSLFRTYAFLERCNRYDRGAVDVLLAGRVPFGKRDRGELETIVQAAYTGATVLLDDARARRIADRYRLTCHGTVWVMERFLELGLLTGPDASKQFALLRHHGVRLPWGEVDQLLGQFGELPLRL